MRRSSKMLVLVTVATILLSIGGRELVEAAASATRDQLLKELVDKARREGALTVFGVSSLGDEGKKVYGDAFKKRFGLENLRFNYVLEGAYGATFGQAIMETQMGIPPTFDVMNGPDHRILALKAKGGIAPIENWEVLLPEGVRAERASPPAVRGLGFVFVTRVKSIIYNTKLITEAALPQTTRDVGLPKYKGKFYISPWPTALLYGVLVYPNDVWLGIVRGWKPNRAMTIRSGPGVQRMMVGEFEFEPFSNAYYYELHRKKGDPAGLAVFDDMVPLSNVLHVVLKGARHPNAGKLFALWAAGPEAVQIFEKYAGTGNVYIKESQVGKAVMEKVEKQGAKVLSWLDSDKNTKILEWYSTPEGKKYEDQISRAAGIK